eukprot:TRINITY_DN19081_c0_g1_i1.p1 TRINITY_DN19081_c0_g1~~TRINITY_DN19081_c0_g1_i1.p1  ORF type:complete len:253 (-),score=88.83 TRINITY_DN19081_c0_g1_i1:25-783(-)
MSWEEDDWEALDSVPVIPVVTTTTTAPAIWEDEDKDVEGWEPEDPSKKSNAPKQTGEAKPTQPKEPKKPKVKGGKSKKEIEMEKEKEEIQITAEEKRRLKEEAEEKVREADLIVARDLFDGIEDGEKGDHESQIQKQFDKLLVTFNPKEEKDWKEYVKAIGKRIEKYGEDQHYILFVKELMKLATVQLDNDDLNEITKALTLIQNEKLKAQKGKGKIKAKTTAKKKLNLPKKGGDMLADDDEELIDDEYDFM